MKLSEITIADVKAYARICYDDEDSIINTVLRASIQYILSYTGLTMEQADNYEDLNIACMCLCSEMIDNRSVTVQNDKINPTVQQILHMYSINFL